MADHVQKTIAELQKKLAEQEVSVLTTKRLINQLSEMAGLARMYSDAELEAAQSVSLSIRSDQFYGQPLATCVKDILAMRKSLNQGPATINEIFAALEEGGFKFDTKNEDNAKRGLRISISKNTALFHKLPNGRLGLTEWYPRVRMPKSDKAAPSNRDSEAEAKEGDQ